MQYRDALPRLVQITVAVTLWTTRMKGVGRNPRREWDEEAGVVHISMVGGGGGG